MEIRIKKFMELQDVVFSTPCEISGRNGQGKTTLLRAILYVLSGKDIDGSTFSENVYPFNPANASDCFADVSVIHEGRTFRKETAAKEIRAAGETESKIVKSINTKYYIDGAIMDKSSFENEVKKYTSGKDFQLFVNPSHFAGLKTDEKRQIFADFFGFKVYESDVNIDTLRTAIKNTKVKESELIAQIKGLNETPKPEPVNDLRESLNAEISKLETEIRENSFTLQPDEIEHNNKVKQEIETLKLQEYPVFRPAERLPLIEFKKTKDVSELLQKLEDVSQSEFDSTVFKLKIEALEKERDNYYLLQNQINNYSENSSNAKCSICPVCELENCPKKKTDLRSIEDLQFEFSLLQEKDWDSEIEVLKSNFIVKKTEFEQSKKAEIERLEKEIAEIEAENSKIVTENIEIGIKNKAIEQQNAEILEQDAKDATDYVVNRSKFEAEKSEKIKQLESSLIVPKQSDNAAKYEHVAELKKQIAENQAQLDNFNKALGLYEGSLQKAEQLGIELAGLRIELAKKERDEIMYKDSELLYYTKLQAEINNVLPFGFSLKLFEKNKSNDNITLTFDLLFNQNLYFSNGQKSVAFAQLCKLFQTKSGVDLPIFIDESAILDEKNMQLILSLQNIIIVKKSNEKLTVKNL